MNGSVPSDLGSNPVRRLVFLAALMIVMYSCMRTLRFTHDGLNIAFNCLFNLLPLFAIKPALRLRRWPKILALTLLTPLLAISVLGLFGMVACEIPDAVNHRAGGHDLRRQIVQPRVPPVPRIWGPGMTNDLGLALDARNDMTLHKSALRP